MADLITAEEVNDYLGRTDGETLITKYFAVVSQSLNAMTCGALEPKMQGSVSCAVDDDGKTVRLGKWFSSVTSVENSKGEKLDYSFAPETYDMAPKTGGETKYGNLLVLDTKNVPGAVLTVSGVYGFVSLPPSLKHLLAALMGAYEARQTGEDAIKTKSIEDVSVTSDTKTGQTPEQTVLETQQSTIDKWSLCEDKYHLGKLAYPDALPKLPYYLTPGMIGGVSSGSISSIC